MNLIKDPWIPVIRRNGTKERIAPWQIAETDNPVVDIAAPRPDFQGALYQFLIGLLQTTCAPEDEDDVYDYWQALLKHEQNTIELKKQFDGIADAFELINDQGPAFLQDFDLPDTTQKPIAWILIDGASENSIKKNLDHFVKRDSVKAICEPCVATALFTLQTNAPEGGQGNMTGIRGGGPLTTLICPNKQSATLLEMLWLNILPGEQIAKAINSTNNTVFPWMSPTRLSGVKGTPTVPDSDAVSPLQVYWGMPRRIRLEKGDHTGNCSICHKQHENLIKHYKAKNYGVNYDGPWMHPLTPYRFDLKQKKFPLSLKGQQGGLGYRHWLALNWQDTNNGDTAAKTVQHFNNERANLWKSASDTSYLLRCFAYDMDKMKARCWYEHQLPLVCVDKDYQKSFVQFVSYMIEAARDTIKELRKHVKEAWFKRSKDVKGDLLKIDKSFWQATESAFNQQLFILAEQPKTTRAMPAKVARVWYRCLRHNTLDLFDQWVLEGDNADSEKMQRIIAARKSLNKQLNFLKSMKRLNDSANSQTDANSEKNTNSQIEVA